MAGRLRGRLEQRGCDVASGDDQWDRMRAGWPVVVGARGTALAPVPKVCGAVVIDADDEAYRSTAAPTWDAVTMLRERCRRDGAPLWLTSSVPSPTLLNDGPIARGATWRGRGRRLSSSTDARAIRTTGCSRASPRRRAPRTPGGDPVAVVVVLQRLGDGRLFACAKCGELAAVASAGRPKKKWTTDWCVGSDTSRGRTSVARAARRT